MMTVSNVTERDDAANLLWNVRGIWVIARILYVVSGYFSPQQRTYIRIIIQDVGTRRINKY